MTARNSGWTPNGPPISSQIETNDTVWQGPPPLATLTPAAQAGDEEGRTLNCDVRAAQSRHRQNR